MTMLCQCTPHAGTQPGEQGEGVLARKGMNLRNLKGNI